MARIVKTRPAGDQTREKILDVAEKLFAANGFDGVSIRQVGIAAEVPFALVTYHFASKLGLYKAVFTRRAEAITEARIARLRQIKLGPDIDANLQAIARAFVEALMRIRQTEWGPTFARLLAREFNDPLENERGIIEQYFDAVAHVTVDLLRQIAPDAPTARVYWAYYFAASPSLALQADTGRAERISGGHCRLSSLDEVIDELTRFIAGGLKTALRLD
jgi:AcrR family transcriptional regulator